MKPVFSLVALLVAAPVAAQQVTPPAVPAPAQEEEGLSVDVTDTASADLTIMIPAMPAAQAVQTPAGNTETLGRQIADVIAADLRNTGLFKPIGPEGVRAPSVGEVRAPDFNYWRNGSAQALVQGYVQAGAGGRLTVGCYLYDVALGTQLTRSGFEVGPSDWRRAAHKCADSIYTRLSGEGPYFDSRVVYVSETGPKNKRIKQIGRAHV